MNYGVINATAASAAFIMDNAYQDYIYTQKLYPHCLLNHTNY